MRRALVFGLIALVVVTLGGASGPVAAGDGTLFVKSAVEHADDTVTLPLYRGTSRGRDVWYIVLDASTGNAADKYGVNRSQKLENAAGTPAVQTVTVSNGVIDFPASVNFAPDRIVEAPNGFPPTVFEPGAIGEDGYSPLIELPNGTILNAPQIANGSGQADKIVSINFAKGKVTYKETNGFQGGKRVKYVSTDASDKLAATLEDVTWAPVLDAAPFVGGDGTDSSRASLAAFVNGQTGRDNPERQGLNSAVADGLDPLNILFWSPNQGRYSPLWDVHLAAWSQDAIAQGENVRQKDFGDILNLADHGLVTAPDGSPFAASGFVVNCPIISRA